MKIANVAGEILTFLSALTALIVTSTGGHIDHWQIIVWLALLMIWIVIATVRRLTAESWHSQSDRWRELSTFWQRQAGIR